MKTTTLLIAIALSFNTAQAVEPLTLMVNASTQKATLMRGTEAVKGFEIIPVATGSFGHETPVGTFPIEAMVENDESKTYGANMPWSIRLVTPISGIRAHEGPVFKGAFSHGCIRIDPAFAEKLFKLIKLEWKTTKVKVVGNIRENVRARVGELCTYSDTGVPTGFKRDKDGKLTQDFVQAIKDGRVTTFCEDKSGKLSFKQEDIYFSLECWGNDRRSKGISTQELYAQFALRPQLSNEQIEKLHARDERFYKKSRK